MADIVDRGQLVVGVDQGKYRVGYRNPLTGELEGTDIDIVRQIATALLGDPSKVKYVALAIADRVPAIEERRVDMVVNSFAVTCERQRSVEFSSAYLTAKMRILAPVGSGVEEVEDLTGEALCTSRGSTTEKVLAALPLNLTVVTKAGIPDCMVEMHRGRVAGVSSDDVLLAGLAAQDPQSEVVGRDLLTTEYAVGLSPDTPDLVRFINAVLEQGRVDGSLQASNEQWLGGYLDPVPETPPASYRD
jgi:polar amino acid transport system substrate-binding protein